MKIKCKSCIFVGLVSVLGCLSNYSAHAQDDEVVNLGATITGNQEQPTVLYIVPWKQTSDSSLLSQGLESRLSDVFDHIDRSEHQRELKYINALTETEKE